DDRNAQGIAIEEGWIFRDIDAVDVERQGKRDTPQRSIRLGAEPAVRLLEKPNVHRRTPVGPPADQRQRAPQIAAHHVRAAITSCRAGSRGGVPTTGGSRRRSLPS